MIFEKFMPNRVNEIDTKGLTYGNFMHYIPNAFKPPTEHIQESPEELRSIVAIFRHGDRSPKQKMKLTTTDPRFLAFFKGDSKELKIKDPTGLTKLLEISNEILLTLNHDHEDYLKILQLKSVLEIDGHFEGLHRKVQMKVI
jgi:inositol hexakisphosphate/diphosphoinositol-pentakisphosphate kinase